MLQIVYDIQMLSSTVVYQVQISDVSFLQAWKVVRWPFWCLGCIQYCIPKECLRKLWASENLYQSWLLNVSVW